MEQERKESSIAPELFYEIIDCLLTGKSFRNTIEPEVLNQIVQILLERFDDVVITPEKLLETYHTFPFIDPKEIIESRGLFKELTKKKLTQLVEICKWVIPFLRRPLASKESFPAPVIIVQMGNGQGKTTLSTALFVLCNIILKDYLKFYRKTVVRKTLSVETIHILQESAQPSPGTLVIMDEYSDLGNMSLSENVSFVIFTGKKSVEKIEKTFIHNPVYTVEIPDMDSMELTELVLKNFSVRKEDIDNLRKAASKLIESKVNPKTALSVIKHSSEYENQLLKKHGFIFNHETIEYIARHAGIAFGHNFNLESLEEMLKARVYGQNHVIDSLVELVGISKYSLNRKNRPLFVAMFGGTTGVGKTECATALAEYLYGPGSLIRIDMGEYTEPHSVSRITGSPPGYVGHNTEPAFVTSLKKSPRRVLLFDEIEKAASTVQELLLGVMDYGQLTTGSGEVLNLRESIVIFTTNALADRMHKSKLGFHFGEQAIIDSAEYREALIQAKIFSPEFLNRIDLVVPFHKMDNETSMKIAYREIESIVDELSYQGFALEYSQEDLESLVASADKNQGGRAIIRAIDKWKRIIVNKIRTKDYVVVSGRKVICIETKDINGGLE